MHTWAGIIRIGLHQFILTLGLAGAGIGAGELLAATTLPPKTDVFVSGRDGYHTYRIPAMAVTNEGTLPVFCEGRKTGSGDHEDVDLVMKRSEDNGATWGSHGENMGSPVERRNGNRESLCRCR